MRSGRPAPLAEVETNQMYQLTLDLAASRAAAEATLASARSFLTSAERDRADGLVLPATSAYHEAARLAITAVATARRLRFRDAPGAHEAVLDYALGIRLIDRAAHARLDVLRELRHQVNYPEDFVTPSGQLMTQIAELVGALMDDVDVLLAPTQKPIPPPPPRARTK